jgi:hypothetical protein
VGLLFCLKSTAGGGKSAKQPEICLAILPKILRISRCGREIGAKDTPWLREVQLSAGYMANSPKIARIVIQITVLARKLAQCPRGNTG